ncbi:hypothetical protein ACSQ67_025836 [Phaseolus vulgaris]
MVSKHTDSASKPRKQLGEPANDALGTLSLKINQLKKQILAERIVYIKIYCAIIPREGSNVDEAEVLRYSKNNLASFKVPKKVFITDSFPKTATGKILRRFVAEHFVSWHTCSIHRWSQQTLTIIWHFGIKEEGISANGLSYSEISQYITVFSDSSEMFTM